eukprot:CAMPEP_0115503122 /NCGR_PEP_ID=MMETSP0271-20121206/69310_1 /TAXON_ID=71861 /ORGANISM="Scrippsiella trochoidea, Strain CCMP3099" /LENGTH=304 /DNA_ID=CAMNT_0002932197 /DNA_START=22 /DNA_END=936 /DNA_ORIENTATION=+
MGSSISFTAAVDSPSEAGAKSIMSDAIDGRSAEELVAGIEKYVRAGGTARGLETKFDVVSKDFGVLVSQRFDIPGFLGGGSNTCHTWYRFDTQKNAAEIQFYANEVCFDRGEPSTTSCIKVHSSPVKVEFWVEAHELRNSGLVLKAMMDKVLSEMGTSAQSSAHQPSVSDASKLSVVSTPIEDSSVTPESFLEFFRKFLVTTMGATELPDESIIEERSGVLGFTSRSFVRHVMDRSGRTVRCYEFGEDESLQDLLATTHCQAHADPFRLEIWSVNEPGRRAGEREMKAVERLLQGVLKDMQSEA